MFGTFTSVDLLTSFPVQKLFTKYSPLTVQWMIQKNWTCSLQILGNFDHDQFGKSWSDLRTIHLWKHDNWTGNWPEKFVSYLVSIYLVHSFLSCTKIRTCLQDLFTFEIWRMQRPSKVQELDLSRSRSSPVISAKSKTFWHHERILKCRFHLYLVHCIPL